MIIILSRLRPLLFFYFILLGNLDINAGMVKRGAAWVYIDYSTDDSFYIDEKAARDNQLG